MLVVVCVLNVCCSCLLVFVGVGSCGCVSVNGCWVVFCICCVCLLCF